MVNYLSYSVIEPYIQIYHYDLEIIIINDIVTSCDMGDFMESFSGVTSLHKLYVGGQSL